MECHIENVLILLDPQKYLLFRFYGTHFRWAGKTASRRCSVCFCKVFDPDESEDKRFQKDHSVISDLEEYFQIFEYSNRKVCGLSGYDNQSRKPQFYCS